MACGISFAFPEKGYSLIIITELWDSLLSLLFFTYIDDELDQSKGQAYRAFDPPLSVWATFLWFVSFQEHVHTLDAPLYSGL